MTNEHLKDCKKVSVTLVFLLFLETLSCSTPKKEASPDYFLSQNQSDGSRWKIEFREKISSDFSIEKLWVHNRYVTILEKDIDLYSRSQALRYIPYEIEPLNIRIPTRQTRPKNSLQ